MPDETRQALPDQSALHGPWTLYVCLDCSVYKFDADPMVIHSRDCGGEFQPVEVVPKDMLAAAVVAGVEVAGKVRDANRADRDRLRAEVEALKAEALDVCGITYGLLTAGVVDDHDRIMRAANELAEFGRRLTGAAPPLDEMGATK